MCQPLVNWWPSLALGLEVEPQHVHTEPIQKDQKDPLEADPWVGLPVPRVDAKRALMLWPSLGLEKCSNPEHVKNPSRVHGLSWSTYQDAWLCNSNNDPSWYLWDLWSTTNIFRALNLHADYWAQRQRLSPGPFFQLGFGDQQRAPHKRIRCYGLLIASKRAKQADR